MNIALQTTLFYTMSTIAQTLSGAMGLLGAIVLFALQGTARSIERAAKRMLEIPHRSTSTVYLRHLVARRNYHELARRYGELLEPGASSEMSLDLLEHHSTLTWELEHDSMLRTSFRRALFASGAVISASLVACALAPALSARLPLGQAVLGAATLGALGCLMLYGVLLRVMLSTTPEEKDPGTESALTG